MVNPIKMGYYCPQFQYARNHQQMPPYIYHPNMNRALSTLPYSPFACSAATTYEHMDANENVMSVESFGSRCSQQQKEQKIPQLPQHKPKINMNTNTDLYNRAPLHQPACANSAASPAILMDTEEIAKSSETVGSCCSWPQYRENVQQCSQYVWGTYVDMKRGLCTIPPLYHPPGSSANATPIEKMDYEQTAMWIWTFGYQNGWEEAKEYSNHFRTNEMRGSLLQQLDEEMLETSLGMKNKSHRLMLLSNIKIATADPDSLARSLSSGSQVVDSTCGSERNIWQLRMTDSSDSSNRPYSTNICWTKGGSYIPSEDIGKCSGYFKPMLAADVSTAQGQIFSGRIDFADRTRQQTYENFKYGVNTTSIKEYQSETQNGPAGTKMTEKNPTIRERKKEFMKLTLTLGDDQKHQDKDAIRARLAEFNITVKSIEESEGEYILTFMSPEMAKEAFQKQAYLHYILKKKWYPRAGPKRRIHYVNTSTSPLTIRNGKSFSGSIVGYLMPNEKVLVNQVKGRRARIVEWKIVIVDGEEEKYLKIIGWVSLHTMKPITLMRQVAELEEFSDYCRQYQDRHKHEFESE